MTTVLTDLSAGHEFPTVRFVLDAQRVRDYLSAAGDQSGFYEEAGAAPPLAIAAFALGVLLEDVSLPEGTLHISESLVFSAPVPLGAEVECSARLAQRSVRAGMVVSVLETEIRHAGKQALTAKATVMSPGAKA